jgi:hypothetical protein
MDEEVLNFNDAAAKLQLTEFRTPKTPGEWQRLRRYPPKRDYTKLFGAVVPLIEAFASASPADRPAAASQLSADALGVLRTFAYSASVVAVRREAPQLIAHGLTALAILGDIDDPRDLSFYLAALHYSALKLGIDTRRLFAEASTLSSSNFFRQQIRDFPMLPPGSRDLRAFNLRETATGEGFDIVQDPR